MTQGIYQEGRLWADVPVEYGRDCLNPVNIPSLWVSPELQKVWENKKLYSEGIDYIVNDRTAVPLPASKESQVDIWDEAFTNVTVRLHPKAEEFLRNNYTITRKPPINE